MRLLRPLPLAQQLTYFVCPFVTVICPFSACCCLWKHFFVWTHTHTHTHFTSIERITALCAGRLNAPGIRLSATPPSKQSHRPHQIDYYSTIGDAFVNTFAQTRTHTLRFLLSPGVFPLTTTAFLPTICRDSAAHTYTRMHTLTSSLTYTGRALYAALCRNPCLASSII